MTAGSTRMPPSFRVSERGIIGGATTKSFGHFTSTATPVEASTASATATAMQSPRRPSCVACAPTGRNTVDIAIERRAGVCHREAPRRPLAAICSSARTVVPCEAPSLARSRARSLVDPTRSTYRSEAPANVRRESSSARIHSWSSGSPRLTIDAPTPHAGSLRTTRRHSGSGLAGSRRLPSSPL